jgi:hypothetical protein
MFFLSRETCIIGNMSAVPSAYFIDVLEGVTQFCPAEFSFPLFFTCTAAIELTA